MLHWLICWVATAGLSPALLAQQASEQNVSAEDQRTNVQAGHSVGQNAQTYTLDYSITTGLLYDNSLTISELDQSSDEGDSALLFKAKADGRWQAAEHITIKGGYTYQAKRHQDLDTFDLQVQQLYVDAGLALRGSTLGASHHFADANLDNDSFLTLNQSTLYFSRLFEQRYFVRAFADYKEKDFATDNRRNAASPGIGGDAYVFFDGGRRYLSVGLTLEKEDARSNLYDYDAVAFRSTLSQKFSLAGKLNQLKLAWRYQDRDYSAMGSAFAADSTMVRADIRRTSELIWELAYNPYLSVNGKLEHGDYRSNLPSAEYKQLVTSIGLRADF
ncbi:MAG: DUF560 domain-containing protein [Pseudomonadales bacterium]|nr:DUF560 domain-containing protein [Pseudomonadales bacterium]